MTFGLFTLATCLLGDCPCPQCAVCLFVPPPGFVFRRALLEVVIRVLVRWVRLQRTSPALHHDCKQDRTGRIPARKQHESRFRAHEKSPGQRRCRPLCRVPSRPRCRCVDTGQSAKAVGDVSGFSVSGPRFAKHRDRRLRPSNRPRHANPPGSVRLPLNKKRIRRNVTPFSPSGCSLRGGSMAAGRFLLTRGRRSAMIQPRSCRDPSASQVELYPCTLHG
jgi:hypothetical protein